MSHLQPAPECRCDLCGEPVTAPYDIGSFQGRRQRVCGPCLEKFVRGIAAVDRAVRRRAA